VEGSCTGRHGFIVLVTRLASVGEGKITTDGTARATFHIKYDCIAFRPFKGEVLDAVVTQVNKFGFFAEAGPLQLFVSNALITEDMKFDSSGENCYVSEDQQIRIQRDCEVRVRIVGMRIDANDIFCIATIKDDYLGLIGFSSAQDGMDL
jgi:DNA-directed RNA polymerase II subunit RPB7